MLITEKLGKVTQSSIYRKWKQGNSDAFLAHLFFSSDDPGHMNAGFYLPKTDRMKVFSVNGDVQEHADEEILKQPDAVVERLEIGSVRVDIEQAISGAAAHLQEKYPQEHLLKHFVILQSIGSPLYNLTQFTSSLHIINLRIDAATGEIISEKRFSMKEFQQK
ncbi:hypothetical protein HY491_03680 [Candidatus Woesearchaeota archaeon]|nr:hypothetical protein [Candidatus Woesearchaeota archaeon]